MNQGKWGSWSQHILIVDLYFYKSTIESRGSHYRPWGMVGARVWGLGPKSEILKNLKANF
jgi:hypothetical protein